MNIELPTGLEHYEFIWDLHEDIHYPNLWLYLTRKQPGTIKPELTPDNKPDRRNFSWSEFFKNTDHVELEIGSGKGGFMNQWAKLHPDRSMLGSEWDVRWARQAVKKFEASRHQNLAMLSGDIFYFLQNHVPDNSLDAAHMYFPDPWPKKKHHKFRLLKEPFLKELRRALKPGSTKFYWATDHQNYNEEACALMESMDFITCIQTDAPPTDGIMTGFETKYRQEGRPIYRSVWEFKS
jgi:tRNA (guanine-N7-)-methyltransferase